MNLDAVRVLTHSAIRLQANSGAVVYCDPYDLMDAPHDASVVLITHNHYDHFSPEDYKKVANEHTVVIAPSTIPFCAVLFPALPLSEESTFRLESYRCMSLACVPLGTSFSFVPTYLILFDFLFSILYLG